MNFFLKIEKFNGHEQIFQVIWPRTWPEYIFPSDMAHDLAKTDFFQVTWPRTWEGQNFHVPSPGLG